MQLFCIELLASRHGAPLFPRELKEAWYNREGERGHYDPSSRRQFGKTSAAYKCLYALRDKGAVEIFNANPRAPWPDYLSLLKPRWREALEKVHSLPSDPNWPTTIR